MPDLKTEIAFLGRDTLKDFDRLFTKSGKIDPDLKPEDLKRFILIYGMKIIDKLTQAMRGGG